MASSNDLLLASHESIEQFHLQNRSLKVQYRNECLEIKLDCDETIASLAIRCAEIVEVEIERLSIFFLPKPGFMKYPFPDRRLDNLLTTNTRVKIVGTPKQEVKKMDEMNKANQIRARPSSAKPVAATRYRDWSKTREDIKFTFHSIEPLPYLPNPDKSKRYLERLASDPGIKAAMRKHKFSVGLLTEMNPAEHTTHESRTLGLNRNRGEVIELRLRTDRYDGYRDYKVIRKTLCHELSHNIHSDHNRAFYDLMKQVEKDVQQGDWRHGGQRLTDQEFYNPDDTADADHADSGGWSGGDFVLGRSGEAENDHGLSRRDILARAAMNRQQKEKEAKEHQDSL